MSSLWATRTSGSGQVFVAEFFALHHLRSRPRGLDRRRVDGVGLRFEPSFEVSVVEIRLNFATGISLMLWRTSVALLSERSSPSVSQVS